MSNLLDVQEHASHLSDVFKGLYYYSHCEEFVHMSE